MRDSPHAANGTVFATLFDRNGQRLAETPEGGSEVYALSLTEPPYEPFEHARPLRELMTSAQLAWYEWRTARPEWTHAAPGDFGYRLLAAQDALSGVPATALAAPSTAPSPQVAAAMATLRDLAAGCTNSDASARIRTWLADLAWLAGLDDEALLAYEAVCPAVAPSARWHMGLRAEFAPSRLAEVIRRSKYTPQPTAHALEYRRELLALFRWAFREGDAWCREHEGTWLADTLGRPPGQPYTAFRGVRAMPGWPTWVCASQGPRPLQECDTSIGAMPLLPRFLRRLEALHRTGRTVPRVGGARLPDAIESLLAHCAQASPIVLERGLRLRGLKGAGAGRRLHKGVVGRLMRDTNKLYALAAAWIDLGDHPLGQGGLFDSTDDDGTTPPDSEIPPGARGLASACVGATPGQIPPGRRHMAPGSAGPHMHPAQCGSADAGTFQPCGGPQAPGHAACELLALIAAADGGTAPSATAEAWARERGTGLVLLLDELNANAIDACDMPVVTERQGTLVADLEVMADLGW